MAQSLDLVRKIRWCFIILMVMVLTACGENNEANNKTNKETKKNSLTEPVDVSTIASVESKSVLKDFSETEFKILDFSERDYNGASSLGIVLSVPLDSRSEFQKYLVLERRDGERVDGAWILSGNGRELFFKNIEPEAEYLLTVYANLKATNNKELGQRYKKSLTTKAIEASISFAHDGGVLPLTHSKGLPVYSINIKQVDVDFHRIKNDKILSFLEQWRGGKESYYRLQQYAQQGELVYSARFDLDIEKNKRERVILPIDTIDELKSAGIYLAVMKTAGKYDYRQAVSYFVRSDIGVHVRRYPGQLNAYLRSLVSGKSLEGITVSLLDHKGQPLIQAQSNSDGMVQFDNSLNKARLLLAQKNQQMSLVKLHSPALDLSEFNIGQQKHYQNEAFFYAPRNMYRPGEVVDISLLLRDFDGRSVPDIPLKAVIKRSDGQVMKRFTWRPEKLGYYHQAYQLPEHARTGKWHIEVQLPGEHSSNNNTSRQWTFSVEDFLPERMKLTFEVPEDGKFITPHETLSIPVAGKYLYGAPASGNRLETQIKTYLDQEAIASLPGYLFGLAEEQDARKSFSLKELELDEQGKAQLEIASRWQKTQSPIAVRVTSSLYETGGRAVKRQTTYRLWPAEKLIGIRPHWFKSKGDNDDDYDGDEPGANTTLGFDIVSADQSGKLYAADNLTVTLIKKRRDYYWKYNNSDEWEMDYSEKQYPVFHQTITISDAGTANLQVPVEWGYYRLEIHNSETNLTSSVEFNAGGSWYYNNQLARVTRPDKVNLILDKSHYSAGDTAQLIIKSPFEGQGMVLIENNRQLLWQQNIDLTQSNELTLDIPVDKDWNRHDIYISAVIFNQLENDSSAKDTFDVNNEQTAKRAIGLVHLPLDREERHINLSIETVEKSTPLSPLPVNIRLENHTKIKDKTIMMTLAAVDVGVLNVSNFTTPDPFSWFFAQRRYSVDSLDLYGNIIDGRKGIVGKQRFGGDMDLSSAGNLQKAKVKIVSLFHLPVTFNKHGEAQIELDIPDFNGQLRLMAVAFGASSYGHAEQNVTIAAPLVTQLSMPLFLAANDESTLTLDVHNLTDKEQTIIIQLSTDEVIEILESQRQLTLKNKEKISLHYTIKSKEQFGLSNINLSISNQSTGEEKIALNRHWQLAVRPAWPAVQRNKQLIIENEIPVTLKINTEDLMPETLAGNLLLSNQPPINLAENLKQLLKYPYGCLEQTTSSSFPWLYATQDNMEKLGLQNISINNQPLDFSKRKQHIARGVQRLSAKQLSNGGFGLWSNQSSEEFWLSVYASHFLLQAREQNIDIPDVVLKAAIKRLQQYLRSTRPGYDYRYSQYPEHLSFAYKAYAAYVLSSIKQAPLGTMRTLFDYHQKDSHSGLPLMHLGIALSRQGDLKRGKEAIEQSINSKRDPHHYLGDYGSIVRDLSLMLESLVRFQTSHPGVNTLLYQLQEELSKRKWLSTQERNALFMVGVALKENGQQQWQAIIKTAVAEQKIIHEGDFQYHMNHDDIQNGISLVSLEKDKLYASLDIAGFTRQPPKADFKHFNITRSYYNAQGEMVLPEQIAVGELLIVELSLQAKNRIQDALVIDLVPAGFEIENQNLAHSLKLDEYRIGADAIIDRMDNKTIKYQAWRDDRYVAAIDLKAYGSQRLYYLLRAVTPGTYQVPPPYAEDMYRPYIRAIGETPEVQKVLNRKISAVKM